jgi:RIO-like serine/threonine protein kinase
MQVSNGRFLPKYKFMCSYQALFHDDNTGYVVRCKECEKIQLGFGNLMLTVATDEFDSFRLLLKKVMGEQVPVPKENLRHIVIPTPCEGMKLLLSVRELREFDRMLEEADTELQTYGLLKLFTNH